VQTIVDSNSNGSVQGSSVDTVISTLSVTGSYQGSVHGPATGGLESAVHLTIGDAIRRGLLYTLGEIGASASVRQARAQRLAALAQLLPNIYGSLSENGAKVDLQAEGFTSSVFSGLGGSSGSASSFTLPTIVGPYHYYSAQANAAEDLSLTGYYNLRSAASTLDATRMNHISARELVVLAVGGSYLHVLSGKANVMSQAGQTKQAEASYKQTKAQFDAGIKTIIDNNKSLIQYRTQQQRLTTLQSDYVKQKMQLARLIGLPPGQTLELEEELPNQVQDSISLQDAIKVALDQRSELKAARLQLQAVADARRAARSEYLPSLGVKGYYGLQGINPDKGLAVFQASGTLTIPIFSSGRSRADVEQADASVAQRQAEFADEEGAIELDVRQSYEDLNVAKQQIKVAEENRILAAETLQQSLDRFYAGVTTQVEVVQSEETVASAERDYVSTLYTLNLSRVSLAKATGQAEKFIPTMLQKGN
jgi:outer membrane protein TolC